jgi:hypothetical protein
MTKIIVIENEKGKFVSGEGGRNDGASLVFFSRRY